MEVILYPFSKRRNSTAVPASDGTSLIAVLKDGTSLISPSLSFGTIASPQSYNYCHIPIFGRYYYVNDWTYDRGIWTASLTEDVLASYKTEILGSTCHVVFSSSDYDSMALDTRIPATAGYDRQVTTASFAGLLGGAQVSPTGYFCLTVLAGTSLWATGASTTYFMTYQQMQTFAHELLEPTVWESLTQFFQNPMDGIIDCYYLPVQAGEYVNLTTDQAVTVGDYAFTATGKMAQSTNLATKYKHITMEIPWGYSDFRRLSPYSEVSLFVPYCGTKSLEPSLLSDVENVLIDYSVDVSTGAVQAICYVKQEVIAEFSGNMKVSLPIGQSQSRVDSIVGAAGGAITAISGFSSGNVALGATGVLSAIQSVATPASQKTMGGLQGSVLGAILGNDVSRWQSFHLIVTSRNTTDTPSNMLPIQGNVCSKVRSLSGLTGYVQTYGASVSAPACDTELQQINSYLDSGIYIE